jgi:hypothetical protein
LGQRDAQRTLTANIDNLTGATSTAPATTRDTITHHDAASHTHGDGARLRPAFGHRAHRYNRRDLNNSRCQAPIPVPGATEADDDPMESGSEHRRPAAARSRPGRPRISVDPRRSGRPPPGNDAGVGAYPGRYTCAGQDRGAAPRFGSGPVELVIPPAPHPDTGSARRRPSTVRIPHPFDPATKEQRQALSKFQPHGVLILQGPIRTQPRQTNEAALYIPADLHRVAEPFARVVADEAMLLLADPAYSGGLDSVVAAGAPSGAR